MYGLIDYLNDYGTNEEITGLKEKAKASDENEKIISFNLPENDWKGCIEVLRKLQKFVFYY